MKQINAILKILLLICISLNSLNAVAQLSLKNPLICHNKENELQYYNDGSFKLYFQHAMFSSFITADSSIKFFAEGRYMEINALDKINGPIKIHLEGNSMVFTHAGKSTIIDSAKANTLFFAGTWFTLYKGSVNYTTLFNLGNKTVYLDIDATGYPKKKWTWDMITIKEDSSSFKFGYNPFYDGGPSLISRQDQNLRYGISIANSFRTNKYVWYVEPVFYEETEKSHVINILNDFRYVYNRRGKLKPKKCIGEIKYCDAE